jgi:glycosyltransferase involved in cell wall biosynthesis
MPKQPLVSVILPFLNGGPAFAPALASILNQSYQNWELLLCDDRSTDGSLEMAQSLKDPRVQVWSDGKNKGLAARLNECISRAQGTLIARMDADDLSYPDRLARQVAYLEAHPATDVVGCPMLIFTEDGLAIGKRRAALDHAGITAHPATGFDLAHPTWMARAEWYLRHLYNPKALRYEDIELLYRSYKTSTFANLPEILYAYREMSGGLKKRLKTRLGRIQYLQARRQQFGTLLPLRAAITEACKTVADAAITGTGQRYAMLRQREQSLSTQEMNAWHAVLAGCVLHQQEEAMA